MVFSSVRHIHFVGIGGIGMSGIAEILLSQGFSVSGSDLHRTEVTDHLASLGARICVGHSADHLGDAEVVVYSSAVRPDANPETRAALDRKIPIIRRAEMLMSEVLSDYDSTTVQAVERAKKRLVAGASSGGAGAPYG